MATTNYLEEPTIISPYNDFFMKSLTNLSPKLKSTNLLDYYNSSKMEYLNSLKSGNFNSRQIVPNNNLIKTKEIVLEKPTLDNNLKIPTKTPTKTTFLDKIGGTSKALSIGSTALDLISGFTPKLDNVSTASNILNIGSTIAGMIPGGQAISLGLKAITTLDQVLGKKSGEQLTAGESVVGYDLDKNLKAGTSYGGLFGNKKRKVTNRLTAMQDSSNIGKMFSSQENLKTMQGISPETTLEKNRMQLQGGFDPRFLLAKKGTKLFELKNIKSKVNRNIQLKKNGGSINLIVGGALHARKNNMDIDGITHKGVPVVSKAEGGELNQIAEVEREELILHKELTNKIEALHKRFKEGDESAALEAGKILVFEILENTQDNSGILEIV